MPATRSNSNTSLAVDSKKRAAADQDPASPDATPRKRTRRAANADTEQDDSGPATPRTPRSPRKKATSSVEDTAAEVAGSRTPRTPRTPRKPSTAATPSTPAGELAFIDTPRGPEPELVPATLSFELAEAKAHLIAFDPRFKGLFDRRACRPYEQLATVDPFRTLATSIISQQIATKAARSITHKFARMYDRSLPEKYEDGQTWPLFPTAKQVAATPLATLRSAGLSARKAEFIFDLANHFADGRITTQKLLSSTHEQLLELLLPVRGIGPWTVEMFSLFSLRNPDILPVGDLGVQRGLARWALAAHSPKDAVTISLDDEGAADVGAGQIVTAGSAAATTVDADAASLLPAPGTPKQTSAELPMVAETPAASRTIAALAPAPSAGSLLPPPITPSITRVLAAGPQTLDGSEEKEGEAVEAPFELPTGLSVSTLRSRLSGKVKVKGAILSPDEMKALTEGWKPYRSIGVYYMWALVDG